jgi:hypothetical protein
VAFAVGDTAVCCEKAENVGFLLSVDFLKEILIESASPRPSSIHDGTFLKAVGGPPLSHSGTTASKLVGDFLLGLTIGHAT